MLVVNLYWLAKSAVAEVLVTWTMPEPVIAPAAPALLITTAAKGVMIVAEPFILRVPATLKLTVGVIADEVLEIVKLLKDVVEAPLIDWVAVPFNVMVPELWVKVPPLVKLPLIVAVFEAWATKVDEAAITKLP